MLSRNRIQFVKSLHQAKFRSQSKQFIVEGPKLVEELLKSDWKTNQLLATGIWIEKNIALLTKSVEIIEISEKELSRISALKTPNQVMGIAEMKPNESIEITGKLILMLDEIKDPGNMGTIIRTSDWFGIDRIICSENCVNIYNPKVVQATMGSLFRVNTFYTDILQYLENLKGRVPVYGTLLEGKSIYNENLTRDGIVLIGNESHGLSSQLIPYITHRISVPPFGSLEKNRAESLNASIAAAIVLSEFRRQSK
ncbi:MAG: RNA methyltransferase [Bacteroidales bacterium]|nr:RNA methyltransferase [Bacteroidales bacterium]